MIDAIEPRGVLVGDCGLPGEQKRDNVFPTHPSGVQLSRNRWLVLYTTRGMRQHDDDRSILYQVRADAPGGAVLSEGLLQRSVNDYDPFGDGSAYVCLLRHVSGFGVPKGAVIGGRPAPSANRFVALWSRSAAGVLDPATGLYAIDQALQMRTIDVMWCQFELNDAEDDIVIRHGPEKLRQVGCESGPDFCSAEGATFMIAGLVPPVPFNGDCTEWACTHESGAGILALRFRFDEASGRYDWVETGPSRVDDEGFSLREPTLARVGDSWVIGVRMRIIRAEQAPDWAGSRARDRGHTGWIRVEDPFGEMPYPTVVEDPHREAPMTVYRCADGVLRLFSGDFAGSPYKQRRDPLYCWDVNPDDFSVSNRHVICDSVRAGIFEDDPSLARGIGFACLFPHAGGREQTVAHRAICFRYLPGMDPKQPPITPEQLAATGVYHAGIRYREECPPTWDFA